jgi:hypothetical protein
MAQFQVSCITPDRNDLDRRIDRLGGPVMGVHPIDTVLRWHVEGHRFYVMVETTVVFLRRIQHPVSKRWFFSTEPDGRYDNNLHSLPLCRS